MVGGNSTGYEKVRIDFDIYEGNMEELPPGYQYVSCHIIFDVNIGENFRRKALLVEGGHKAQHHLPLLICQWYRGTL